MSNVIGFAGAKRSGKDSSARYFVGRLLVKNGITTRFDMTEDGELMVESDKGLGIINLENRSPAFISFCHEVIWPITKLYHFADELKTICMNLYGLTEEQCYGSSEQKQSPSQLKWFDFSTILKKNEIIPKGSNRSLDDYMTAREVLQTVSDVMKKINEKCWSDCVIKQITEQQSLYPIVADVRYPFEVDAIKAIGGKIVYLTRRVEEDSHASENAFKDYDMSNFDAVIENQDLSIADKNTILDRHLQEFGYL